MDNALESIPFSLTDPTDPSRIVRGVIDQPAGTRAAGSARVPIFILHGFKGFFRWGFFPELAHRLASHGFAAVRFNFAGSGVGADLENFTEGAAFEANSPSRECQDATRVIEEITGATYPSIAGDRIGVIGHSMGGAVGFLLAGGASPREVGALVTWGSVKSFDRFEEEQKALIRKQGWLPVPNGRTGQIHRLGRAWLNDIDSGDSSLRPLSACPNVSAPTLLLHGTQDQSVDVSEAHELLEALPSGGAHLELLEGAGHTFGATHPMESVPPHLEQALVRSLDHFCRHLI